MSDKFRPVNWSDLNQPGAHIIGWGIERKKEGERRYKPVGWKGEIHPFKTKKEAQAVCNDLNENGITKGHAMKTTIDMAREAGAIILDGSDTTVIDRLVALVRADEREACAQIAADYGPSRPIVSKNPSSQIVGRWEGEQAASAAIDAAIRARGNT